jgi:hypothetical protein
MYRANELARSNWKVVATPHMSDHMQRAAATRENMQNMHEGIEHIIWTIEHSPKAYALFRQRCILLRQTLVNAELRHQAEKSAENPEQTRVQ